MSKVYQIAQDKIISQLEEAIKNNGTAPWRKPWVGGMPKNYVTKKPYRGINLMVLEGGSYLTFKQITDLQKKNKEIKLKKGSKSHTVFFWQFNQNETDDENKYGPIFKFYRVFSVSDVEGIEEDVVNFGNQQIENAEDLIKNFNEEVKIIQKFSDRAYYSPTSDHIVMPELKQFENPNEFYSTMFHEMIHSTGHKSRLNRFDGTTDSIFGNESYSKEELVAEIGSNMILSMMGIEDESQQENSISYLYGWLQKIKEDPKLITNAAQKSQKAADYILEFQEEKNTLAEQEAV
jgi:antirestriction protein ArdC